jgi:hypothetical protein
MESDAAPVDRKLSARVFCQSRPEREHPGRDGKVMRFAWAIAAAAEARMLRRHAMGEIHDHAPIVDPRR